MKRWFCGGMRCRSKELRLPGWRVKLRCQWERRPPGDRAKPCVSARLFLSAATQLHCTACPTKAFLHDFVDNDVARTRLLKLSAAPPTLIRCRP